MKIAQLSLLLQLLDAPPASRRALVLHHKADVALSCERAAVFQTGRLHTFEKVHDVFAFYGETQHI